MKEKLGDIPDLSTTDYQELPSLPPLTDEELDAEDGMGKYKDSLMSNRIII